MADVGCAGILVADTFCGPIERLPREGELLAIDHMPVKLGGCAANVAVALAKHGIGVDVCGCVGNDDDGDVVCRRLAAAGIGCGAIRAVKSHPTSKTVILLVKGQDRRFLHSFGANAAFDVAQISRGWIDSLKVFYVGGLLAMPGIRMGELAELLAYCRRRQIVTVVDVVVPHDYEGLDELRPLLPHVDCFLPNDDEAQRLTGRAEIRDQIDAMLAAGARTVVITRGPHGSIAAAGRDRWEAGAYHVEAIDPCGSGDAFDAGIIAGILRGWAMPETLRFAAAMGASATTAVGATDGLFGPAETQAFLDQNSVDVKHYTA